MFEKAHLMVFDLDDAALSESSLILTLHMNLRGSCSSNHTQQAKVRDVYGCLIDDSDALFCLAARIASDFIFCICVPRLLTR